jgi:Putative beta-barrel porin-2, OmpL-like. bbp2
LGLRIMKKFGLIGLALALPSGLAAFGAAQAADSSANAPGYEALGETPVPKAKKMAPVNCKAPDAPYKNYSCLDAYLGDGFFERLVNYYRLEWGHEAPPADPNAIPGRRDGWPATPQSTPPFPFTEWPYGAATSLGVTRTGAVDSPLMVALANTAAGKWMNETGIQIYGWVNPGANLSTSTVTPGGNFPAAYAYSPNTGTLDQAVVYIERAPDTVQTDHIDWGFRFSTIYGENYRYTTSYGVANYQLLGHNLVNGYDFPMVYGELFIPEIAQGLLLRLGRYISIPDIEAQLAPNNYMYSHSMTYGYDNYTNEGLLATLAVTKNFYWQAGISLGTEAVPWHLGQTVPNPFPNVMYPGNTMPKDPGAVPAFAGGIRYQSDSGYDTFYLTYDGINAGQWGYNNLQWFGGTFYHKFNEQWHLSWEAYTLSQHNVLNATDPAGIIANGGFPFTLANGFNFNSPFTAQCANPTQIACTARVFATVAYLNYKFSPLDNISFRPEFYNDMEGQRTGVKTRYANFGVGWQHWFSTQVEIRPEVVYYHSLDANAFNGNFNNCPASAACPAAIGVVAPTRNYEVVGSMDLIWHF